MVRLSVPLTALLALGACATSSLPSPGLDPRFAPLDRVATPSEAPPLLEAPQSAEPAQSQSRYDTAGGLAVGVGATFDPSTFLIGATVDLPATNEIYWGPAVELGLSNSRTLIAAFLQGKYTMGSVDADKRFHPYLQTGIGFAYEDLDRTSGEASLLLNVGGGLRFDLSDRVRLGSQVLVNWMPGEIHGEHVYVSWEIGQIIVPF